VTTTLVISDLHLSTHEARHSGYSWISDTHTSRLIRFLRSDTVLSADRLVLAGDVLDLWAHPIDRTPPKAAAVIEDNRPVADALRAVRQVVYIPGNHDMDVTGADAAALLPAGHAFGSRFDIGALHVRHGHEQALFNGPDPVGRRYPLGYYLTRIATTGVLRGNPAQTMDVWTILKNGSEVLRALAGKPLAECVFDVVCAAAGVGLSEKIHMPDGSCVISVGDIRDTYADLVTEWNRKPECVDADDAILAEWDPWYALETADAPRLTVMGHSHAPLTSELPDADQPEAYLNTGAWCLDSDPTFAKVWTEYKLGTDPADAVWTCGQLRAWRDRSGQSELTSTIYRV
jgi:hypothetical protein